MAIQRHTHRNPWQEIDQLTNRLSRMFDTNDWPGPSSSGQWVPPVNVEETADELRLTAELPGLGRDDVEIELENNVLTVRGEKTQERPEDVEERRFHVWERRYGSFQRSFTLPRTVQGDRIGADFEDGILTIRMPKAPEAKGRRIEIGSGATEAS